MSIFVRGSLLSCWHGVEHNQQNRRDCRCETKSGRGQDRRWSNTNHVGMTAMAHTVYDWKPYLHGHANPHWPGFLFHATKLPWLLDFDFDFAAVNLSRLKIFLEGFRNSRLDFGLCDATLENGRRERKRRNEYYQPDSLWG
jgi:hypothetical protein